MKDKAESELDDLRRMEANAEDKFMMFGHEGGWFSHEEFITFATAHPPSPSTGPKADTVCTKKITVCSENRQGAFATDLASNGCMVVRMYMIVPNCSRLV